MIYGPDALIAAAKHLKTSLVTSLRSEFENVYQANHDAGASPLVGPDAEAVGKRRLKNTALDYLMALMALKDDALSTLSVRQFSASVYYRMKRFPPSPPAYRAQKESGAHLIFTWCKNS